jgi:hypothetical protein
MMRLIKFKKILVIYHWILDLGLIKIRDMVYLSWGNVDLESYLSIYFLFLCSNKVFILVFTILLM